MRNSTYLDAQSRIVEAATLGFVELNRTIRATEVADKVGYSVFHFQRLFRAMVGESWADYHRRLRLELAGSMIQLNDYKVSAIAIRCGFESHEVFARAFKSAYGCKPSEFLSIGTYHPILPSPNGVHQADPHTIESLRTLREPGVPIPFEVRPVEAMHLVGMRYKGPLQFVSSAWLKLNDWANEHGIDLNTRLLVTCAEELDEETPPADHEAFVAMDDLGEEGLERFIVDSGLFLVARHQGSGHLLADFWLRLYCECIPESGHMLRESAAFQIYPSGLFVEDPNQFVTDVYVPVHPK
ncbi:MAG: helix-turn-helix domain-containing protein [Chlorobia bacterium]|nr:helix-turn-helix domain-containing protein [Fimbriimonadaceae bacterium]